MIDEGGTGNIGTLSRHWMFVASQNKSPYLIEGWVVPSDSIVFLDKELYKGRDGRHSQRLIPEDIFKSSLVVPLSSQSSHHKSVHNWWPLGETRRFPRRSTQHNDVIPDQNQFIQRLETHNYDQTVVDMCTNLEFTEEARSEQQQHGNQERYVVVSLSTIKYCPERTCNLLWTDGA